MPTGLGVRLGLGGGSAAEALDGSDGNDLIQGHAGNDWLAGGGGSDSLEGGGGDDLYHFARGDGADTVFDDHWYEQTPTEQASYTYYTWEWAGNGDDEWNTTIQSIAAAHHQSLSVGQFAQSHGLSDGVTGYVYHNVLVAIYAW